MRSDKAAAAFDSDVGSTRRFFTVESANKALVLVRRVVQDIVSTYAELMKLRSEFDQHPADKVEAIAPREVIERTAERLRALHDELGEVGCELKDAVMGLVDFPAIRHGRRVCLCWKLGEPAVGYWHEEPSGYAGRKLIDADFDAPAE